MWAHGTSWWTPSADVVPGLGGASPSTSGTKWNGGLDGFRCGDGRHLWHRMARRYGASTSQVARVSGSVGRKAGEGRGLTGALRLWHAGERWERSHLWHRVERNRGSALQRCRKGVGTLTAVGFPTGGRGTVRRRNGGRLFRHRETAHGIAAVEPHHPGETWVAFTVGLRRSRPSPRSPMVQQTLEGERTPGGTLVTRLLRSTTECGSDDRVVACPTWHTTCW